MINNYLIANDFSTNGIYRAMLNYDGINAKIYIPCLSDGKVPEENAYTMNGLFISNEMKKLAVMGKTPCWVTFEVGSSKRPIILGYFGKGLRSIGGGFTSSENSSSLDVSNSNDNSNEVIINDNRSDISKENENINKESQIIAIHKNSTCPDANEYSFDSTIQLSNHFNVQEFKCKCYMCNKHCNDNKSNHNIRVVPELVDLLENIRKDFGKSININSAYRCLTHNKCQGGASNSQHVNGSAVDIHCSTTDRTKIQNIFRKYYPNSGGCGLYSWGLHIDVRYKKADW